MQRELAGTRPAWRVAWRAAISVMSIRDLYGGQLLARHGTQGSASMQHDLVSATEIGIGVPVCPSGLVCNA